jgi:hypothetical protein
MRTLSEVTVSRLMNVSCRDVQTRRVAKGRNTIHSCVFAFVQAREHIPTEVNLKEHHQEAALPTRSLQSPCR